MHDMMCMTIDVLNIKHRTPVDEKNVLHQVDNDAMFVVGISNEIFCCAQGDFNM